MSSDSNALDSWSIFINSSVFELIDSSLIDLAHSEVRQAPKQQVEIARNDGNIALLSNTFDFQDMITAITRQKQLKYLEFQFWKRPFDDLGGK